MYFTFYLIQMRDFDMKNLLIILSFITLGLVSVNTIAKDKKEPPEYTVEGLKRVHDAKGMALVYAEEGADLSNTTAFTWQSPTLLSRKTGNVTRIAAQ